MPKYDSQSSVIPRTPKPRPEDGASEKAHHDHEHERNGDLTPPLPTEVHVKGEQTHAPPSEEKPHDSWTSRQI